MRSAAFQPEDPVDVRLLSNVLGEVQALVGAAVVLQAFLQVRLRERLDQVMHNPAPQRTADRLHLSGGTDHQHVQFRRRLPQPGHEVQPVDIGQVDVQQHQVGLQAGGFRHGLGSGVRNPHDGESRRALDKAGVDFGHHEVVVDDQDIDHGLATLPLAGIRFSGALFNAR